MKFIKEIIEYAKDNPDGYWFKAKLYGYGWMPVTREGWFVTLLAMVLIVGNTIRFEQGGYDDAEVLLQLLVPTFIIVVILIFICIRTGEKPHWNWGPPKRKKKEKEERGSQPEN